MKRARKAQRDPAILSEILREVAKRAKRPATHWISVGDLDLDYTPEQIDAAIAVLVDRGWLSGGQSRALGSDHG